MSGFGWNIRYDIGPLTLTPGTAGTYVIGQGPYPADWGFSVTGSYTVAGPTQTVSGTFSKPRTIYQYNSTSLYPRWNLDAASYPGTVSLSGEQLVSWNSTDVPYEINTVVDGVGINVYTGGSYYQFLSPLTLTPVPEPTPLVFLALTYAAMLLLKRQNRQPWCRNLSNS